MNGTMRWGRWVATGIVAGGMLWGAFAIPIPRTIASIGLLKPATMGPVFVRKDGYLRQFKEPGDTVEQGEMLAVFEAPADQLSALAIAGEIAALQAEIRGVESRLSDHPQLAATLTELKETLTEREKTYLTWQAELEELAVHSPAAGKLIEPTWNIPPNTDEEELQAWQGEPLTHTNLDGWFPRGVLLGWIINDQQWNLEAYVSETQVPRIGDQATAAVRLDRQTDRDLNGHVVRIDPQPVQAPPFLLKEDPRLTTQMGDNGQMRLDETYYRVIIALDERPVSGSLDSIASVRIAAAPATLSTRVREYVRRTFRD